MRNARGTWDRQPSCVMARWCNSRKSWPSRTGSSTELQPSKKFLKEEVDEEDIAEVVAKWTGIPGHKMLEGESQADPHGRPLRERVLGQDPSPCAVSESSNPQGKGRIAGREGARRTLRSSWAPPE